jgi:uncharacterized protein YegL
VAIAVLGITPTLPGQQTTQAPSLRISQIQVSPDGQAQAIVSVTDDAGNVPQNLSEANFRITTSGRQVRGITVSHVAAGNSPLSIVLAIDVSGSMHGEGLADAVRGASAFADRLSPQDRCALMVFGSDVRTVTGFTDDRVRIKNALAQLTATDKDTHLYQAIFDALDTAATAPTHRAAIVLLTDGKDEGSPLGLQEVAAKAMVRDLPIFTLAYGPHADVATLRRIAAVSHGRAYVAPGAKAVTDAYSDIGTLLRTDYMIGFTLTEIHGKPFTVSVTFDYRGQSAHAVLDVTPTPGEAQEGQPGHDIHPVRSPWFVWGAVIIVVVLAAGGWFYWRRRRSGGQGDLARTMMPPRVWLEVVKGADTGQKTILFEDEALIGRDRGKCQIILKNDPLVGRQHAHLRKNGADQFVLTDRGSQNGTSVNGVWIKGPVTLQNDDHIVVGLSELLFVDHR